jgi:hypothetical protein
VLNQKEYILGYSELGFSHHGAPHIYYFAKKWRHVQKNRRKSRYGAWAKDVESELASWSLETKGGWGRREHESKIMGAQSKNA